MLDAVVLGTTWRPKFDALFYFCSKTTFLLNPTQNQPRYLSAPVLLKSDQKHRSDRIVSIHHCLVQFAIKPVKHNLVCRPDAQTTTAHCVLATHRLVTGRTRLHFFKCIHSVNVSQYNFCQKHYLAVGRIAGRSAKLACQYHMNHWHQPDVLVRRRWRVNTLSKSDAWSSDEDVE